MLLRAMEFFTWFSMTLLDNVLHGANLPIEAHNVSHGIQKTLREEEKILPLIRRAGLLFEDA
jgi:hypothetical protein